MKRVLLAPDSFKNCLRSIKVIEALKQGILAQNPAIEVIDCPLADGGEGTIEAFYYNLGGEFQEVEVTGPLGKKVIAKFLLSDNGRMAVMEVASACGIELIEQHELNPMQTTTYGVGELLKYILEIPSVEKIIIGLGGSSTVDGGVGMLQGIGINFFDQNNKLIEVMANGGTLSQIYSFERVKLRDVEIVVACDVENPLCGKLGAAKVFGPQKGATSEQVEVLDNSLMHWAKLVNDNGDTIGDGAAGGLGFAFRKFFNSKRHSGSEYILKQIKFDEKLKNIDLVITGEGKSDFQTAHGKLPYVVAYHCQRLNIPVWLISGVFGKGIEQLSPYFNKLIQNNNIALPLEENIHNAFNDLTARGKEIATFLDSSDKIILTTNRLYLREMRKDDFPLLCQMLQDIEVMYAWEHGFSDDEVHSWIERNILRYQRDGYGYWLAFERETNKLVGQMGLISEEINSEIKLGIGWILLKKYWGLGYASEGARGCLKYARNTLGAKQVIADIRPSNYASISVAERLGMQRVGSYDKVVNGQIMTHILYEDTFI